MSNENLSSKQNELIVAKEKKDNIKYSNFRKFISRKDIASYIIKYFVSEFQDADILDIKNSLESGVDEKHVKIYKAECDCDGVLFEVKLFNSNKSLIIYIDFETQDPNSQDYPSIANAIINGFDLLLQQKFNSKEDEYLNFKKVYSILLDTSLIDNKESVIKSIITERTALYGYGSINGLKKEVIDTLYANISNNCPDDQYKSIVELLYLIFMDASTPIKNKLDIIKNKYDIIDLDEEFKQMCKFLESTK